MLTRLCVTILLSTITTASNPTPCQKERADKKTILKALADNQKVSFGPECDENGDYNIKQCDCYGFKHPHCFCRCVNPKTGATVKDLSENKCKHYKGEDYKECMIRATKMKELEDPCDDKTLTKDEAKNRAVNAVIELAQAVKTLVEAN